VRGRNSDNSRLRQVLGWEPRRTFRQGIVPTYAWIASQVTAKPAPAEQQLELDSAAG
jgi:dTDP-D-glucose 4,6-dehydratase